MIFQRLVSATACRNGGQGASVSNGARRPVEKFHRSRGLAHCTHWAQAYAATMMSPPSLPKDVKDRAFRAHNGELGILLADAAAFLDACRSDGVRLLGWELWVVDHRWDAETNWPAPETGSWGGGIPVVDHDVPAVIRGDGDVDETSRQIASIDFEKEVRNDWLPHIRVNFALDN